MTTSIGAVAPIFNFENLPVRLTQTEDQIWFAAQDVMNALEYAKSYKPATALGHVPEEWKGVYPIHTLGGEQKLLCLSEPGLYFFLGRSDKPKALPFQKWLAGDVLPAIRKTGSYSYRVTPKQTLSAEQADELRSLITTHAETLPKGSQAAFVIQAWSKLKAHFGVGYRQIPANRFTEALSILARHVAGQSAPSLLNRRWLVSIDHLGCEQVTPIPGDAGILRLADLPETLRDTGALIDAELLAEIGAACFERLRSKVGALKEARFIASQRRRAISG